jgi:outer membrane protein assembly factor BamB
LLYAAAFVILVNVAGGGSLINRPRFLGEVRMVLRCTFLFGLLALASVEDGLANENWPQWRGPFANGTSTATNLPTSWNIETGQNIVWKKELPHWSGGTPVIWGDRIFITSPSQPPDVAPASQSASGLPAISQPQVAAAYQPQPGQRGRGPGGGRGGRGGGRNPGGQELMLLCLSRATGDQLWQYHLDSGNRYRMKQNSSSPSPVTDGTHVWATTGNGVVTALTMDGKFVWKRELQKDYGEFGLNHGFASSPLLYNGNLIIPVLHGMTTDEPSYVVALSAATGQPVWRVERPTDAVSESPDAYTTPALLKVNGQDQIVVTGGDYVTGHDPATGKEVWRSGGLNPRKARDYRIIPSPLIVGDIIIAPTRKNPLLAIRGGGTGDITESHRLWTYTENLGPDVPTPVSDGKYLFIVEDAGLVTCLDLKTKAVVWGPTRTASGVVSSSPLLVDGKLYVVNEQSVTTVLEAGPEFKVLGTSELDGSYTLSSPVAVGNRLFIRTGTHLYCIGSKASP